MYVYMYVYLNVNYILNKQITMLAYQCSPLSTSRGIIEVIQSCAMLQKQQDLNKFVAVAVLDEVGLAEDSPDMPLKVSCNNIYNIFI